MYLANFVFSLLVASCYANEPATKEQFEEADFRLRQLGDATNQLFDILGITKTTKERPSTTTATPTETTVVQVTAADRVASAFPHIRNLGNNANPLPPVRVHPASSSKPTAPSSKQSDTPSTPKPVKQGGPDRFGLGFLGRR